MPDNDDNSRSSGGGGSTQYPQLGTYEQQSATDKDEQKRLAVHMIDVTINTALFTVPLHVCSSVPVLPARV